MLELQMVPNGTTEVEEEVEESPVPLAILNEDNNDTSTPFSNTHGRFTYLPWVVIGNFNWVLSPSEVEGGSSSWPAWQDDLGNCLATLKKLKLTLKEFNKEHFSNLPTRVTRARTDLEHVQCLIQHSPLDSSLHREETLLQKEFCELSRAKESFLGQKARVK
ncbi:unnamed protein product [Fraxinus pennsylvanica]|uniref:Uncharacterized protein n=1 Tax=Fraxinus pennsylvanica TaxID=56036 RepID=A0AAD1ZF07_9LAMI|nr:unnamed protein product [Fraxinus pennsylvanica]